MSAFQGAFVKATEVVLLFPFHHAIHKSQTNCKGKLHIGNLYSGIQFQLFQAPTNRFVDIKLYETYGSSMQSSLLSSIFKLSTYPLHTAEVHYQLKNKLPSKFSQYYKGIVPYMVINTYSYYLWFNSLEWYKTNLPNHDNVHITNGIVGFCSGLTVDVFLHPLKTIKTNLQNNSFRIQDVAKPSYLFRGFTTKILLSASQTAYFNIFCPL